MSITITNEKITPSKAQTFLLQNKANRPINKANLDALIYQMKKGLFHTTGESIKIDENGILVDGQHRLQAIVKTGKEFYLPVVRGLSSDAFKYIDTGKKRTAADVLGIDGVANPAKVASVVSFILNFSSNRYSDASSNAKKNVALTNAMVSEFFDKNKESVKESISAGFIKGNTLFPGTLLAGLHYEFKKLSHSLADEFIWKVATGEKLEVNTPIWLLRRVFISDQRSIKKIPRLAKTALICKTWNIIREGKKITILKWDWKKEGFPRPK